MNLFNVNRVLPAKCILCLHYLPAHDPKCARSGISCFFCNEIGEIGVGGASANIVVPSNGAHFLAAFGTNACKSGISKRSKPFGIRTTLARARAATPITLSAPFLLMAGFVVVAGVAPAASAPVLQIRSTTDGSLIRTLDDPRGNESPLRSLDVPNMAFSRNGKFIVAACRIHQKIFVWESETGRFVKSLGPLDNYSFAVGYSDDDQLVYSVSAIETFKSGLQPAANSFARSIPCHWVGQSGVIYNAVVPGCSLCGVSRLHRAGSSPPTTLRVPSGSGRLGARTGRADLSFEFLPKGVQLSADHRSMLVVSESSCSCLTQLLDRNWVPLRVGQIGILGIFLRLRKPWTLAADDSLSTFFTPNGAYVSVWRIDWATP